MGKSSWGWMDKLNLTLLNLDLNCKGEITWSRGDQKSAIDLVLVNPSMCKFYKRMIIDEENFFFFFDLLDHNQIDVQFSMKEPKVKYARETRLIEYY